MIMSKFLCKRDITCDKFNNCRFYLDDTFRVQSL